MWYLYFLVNANRKQATFWLNFNQWTALSLQINSFCSGSVHSYHEDGKAVLLTRFDWFYCTAACSEECKENTDWLSYSSSTHLQIRSTFVTLIVLVNYNTPMLLAYSDLYKAELTIFTFGMLAFHWFFFSKDWLITCYNSLVHFRKGWTFTKYDTEYRCCTWKRIRCLASFHKYPQVNEII